MKRGIIIFMTVFALQLLTRYIHTFAMKAHWVYLSSLELDDFRMIIWSVILTSVFMEHGFQIMVFNRPTRLVIEQDNQKRKFSMFLFCLILMGVSLLAAFTYRKIIWFCVGYVSGVGAINYFEAMRIKDGFYENMYYNGLNAIYYHRITDYWVEGQRLFIKFKSKFLFVDLLNEYDFEVNQEEQEIVEKLIKAKQETT